MAHEYSDITFVNTHFTVTASMPTMLADLADFSVELSCETSACPPGLYGECEAFGSCYSCEVDVCHRCPPGTATTDAGLVSDTDCISCEVGKFSNTSGASYCDICQSGHYATTDRLDKSAVGASLGATFCVPCPSGKYQAQSSSYFCDSCAAGSTSSGGSRNCTACESGKYARLKGQEICDDCPLGKYSARNGSITCNKCISPEHSTPGSSQCNICVESYYRDPKDDTCRKCPEEGAHCGEGTTLENIRILEGYWRLSVKSKNVLECIQNPGRCRGNNGSSYCQGHSRGPYCAVCDDGYWNAPAKDLEADSCQSCAGGSINFRSQVLLGIASFIVILLLMQIWLKYKRGTALGTHYMDVMDNYSKLKTKLKISTTFAQVAASFPEQFNVAYPRTFQDICEQLSFIFSLQVYPLIPAQCAMDTRKELYMFQLLSKTLAPLVVIGLGLIYYAVRRHIFSRRDTQKTNRLNESAMFWFLLFTYLIYPPCSTVVLAVFDCEDLGSGEIYMRADYSTPCDTKGYRTMEIYAAIFIFIYPLGCPLMYFVLMWHRRFEIDPILPESNKRARMAHSRSDVDMAVALRLDNHELAPLAFLFESYEPQFWWWEVLVCMERLLLTNANIYLSTMPVLQPFVVLVVALASVKVYTLLDPYMLDSDDLFAEIKDWAIVSMVIFTIIIQVHEVQGINMPRGVNVMLVTTLLAVYGILVYFCLTTIVTETSFFDTMVTRMFPETTEMVKRRARQLRRAPSRDLPVLTGEDTSIATEEQGRLGVMCAITMDPELAGSAGLEMAMVHTHYENEMKQGHEIDVDQSEEEALRLYDQDVSYDFEI